jgi:hypothetical protein
MFRLGVVCALDAWADFYHIEIDTFLNTTTVFLNRVAEK